MALSALEFTPESMKKRPVRDNDSERWLTYREHHEEDLEAAKKKIVSVFTKDQ